MDDDIRRRLLQTRSGNVGQISTPSQVPSFLHALDPITGKVAVRLTQGEGVDFFSDRNSMPRIASVRETNGYIHGANFVKDMPPVTGRVLDEIRTAPQRGLNFLALDPNETKKPGGDSKGKRGENSVAIFPG